MRFLSVLCLVGSFPQGFVIHRRREAGGLAPFVERPVALARPLFQQGKEVLFNSDELCPSPLQVPSSRPCVSLSQE